MAKQNKEDAIQWYAQNRDLYCKLSQKVHNIISELLEESNITVHAITDRTKDLNSFKKKIEDVKYDDPLNQITDFSGIRIIAYVEDDLGLISKIIEDAFDIDIDNSGDKAKELGTDKVGYKSIHYIAKIKQDRIDLPEYRKYKNCKFEIQIRTILQHAWAEIEHDRNYKFTGVLPPEITRRFKILAGTLELIDREFNQLSIDIDEISQAVINAGSQNELNSILINSTTLKEFLSKRLSNQINAGTILPQLKNDEEILNELNDFGIYNLHDLDKIITNDFINKYNELLKKIKPVRFLGLLRDIMIAYDFNRYFEKAWKGHWTAIDDDTLAVFKKFKINPDEIIGTYINPPIDDDEELQF